jgi:RimJ/RimL family protein N-acetyltransferase
VIVVANNQKEWVALREFLRMRCGVVPSDDMVCIGWVSDGKLQIVVGYNGFIGKVAQIHLAFAPGWHFPPRAMLRECFRYAFETAKLEMLIGVLNSKNERAMRFDQHLGFRELHRLPGMHDDDGDIVMLGMTKSECRYIDQAAKPQPEERHEHSAMA